MLTLPVSHRTTCTGAEMSNCLLDQFEMFVNNGLEDGAEDVVEIEGTLVDFPRAWNNPEPQDGISPVLIRVAQGDLFWHGLPSYELTTSSTALWQLLSPDFIFPGITGEFSGTFDGIATSGGLVLIPCGQDVRQVTNNVSSRSSNLIVSNPIERSYRNLPQMFDLYKEMTCSTQTQSNVPPPQVMGIFMDAATGAYYIPVIQRFTVPGAVDVVAMQVYESNAEAWRIFGQWQLSEPESKDIVEMTYVEGEFFFLVYDHGHGHHEILFLRDDEWQAIGLLPAGYTLFNPTIFEHSGFLMLGGFLPKEQVMKESDLHCMISEPSDELRFGYIWYHNFGEMKWHHYCKVPFYWSYDLYYQPPGIPNCTLQIVAAGGYICVASSNGRTAKFDTVHGEWTWLPEMEMNSDDKIFILEGKAEVPDTSAF